MNANRRRKATNTTPTMQCLEVTRDVQSIDENKTDDAANDRPHILRCISSDCAL
jgi:hypothetical protein